MNIVKKNVLDAMAVAEFRTNVTGNHQNILGMGFGMKRLVVRDATLPVPSNVHIMCTVVTMDKLV